MDIEKSLKGTGNCYLILAATYFAIIGYIVWIAAKWSINWGDELPLARDTIMELLPIIILLIVSVFLGVVSRRFLLVSNRLRLACVLIGLATGIYLFGNVILGLWALYKEGKPEWFSWSFIGSPGLLACAYLYLGISLLRARFALTKLST